MTMIFSVAAMPLASANYGTFVVIADNVNVRAKPSIDADVFGVINKGPVTAYEFKGNWVLIQSRGQGQDSLTGWVNKKILMLEQG